MDPAAARKLALVDDFSVVLRNFLLWASHHSEDLLIAVEGVDDHYYDCRLRTHLTEVGIKYFHSGGRDNVLGLYDRSAQSGAFQRLCVAFIVDQDYAKPTQTASALYVTPGYSIESFYVSEAAICRAIRSVFDLRDFRNDALGKPIPNMEAQQVHAFCVNVMRAFDQQLGLNLNAFLKTAYLKRLEDAAVTRVNTKAFDASKFPGLFEVDESGFKLLKDVRYESLLNMFGVTEERVPRNAFDAELLTLQNGGYTRASGRGKFPLVVLIALFTFLLSDARRTKPRVFQTQHLPKMALKFDAPLLELSSFADTSPCLPVFAHHLATKYAAFRAAPVA